MKNNNNISPTIHQRRKNIFMQNVFHEINLYDLFNYEEVEKLLNDPMFTSEPKKNKFNKVDYHTAGFDSPHSEKNKGCIDRTVLIINFLRLSILKLKEKDEKIIAKGLEW